MKNYIFAYIITFCFAKEALAQDKGLEKYESYFNTNLKAWKNTFINFKLTNFKKESKNLKFENIEADSNFDEFKDFLPDFYAIYKPLLSFSPDKNKFIDIYSYQLNLEKQGNKLLANPTMEQSINLCHLKNRTWKRILFCGTYMWIDEIIWIDDFKFMLVGTENSKRRTPKILIGDILTNHFEVYSNTNQDCYQKKQGYQSVKMKQMKIEGL